MITHCRVMMTPFPLRQMLDYAREAKKLGQGRERESIWLEFLTVGKLFGS